MSGFSTLRGIFVSLLLVPGVCGQCFEYPETRLTSTNINASDFYGQFVDIDGDVFVAGAQFDEVAGGTSNSGVVFVYRYNGTAWLLEQTLVSPTPQGNAAFGAYVSIDGNRMLVGAAEEVGPDPGLGSVCVFRYDGPGLGWVLEQQIDPVGVARFGSRVELNGDLAVISGTSTVWAYRRSGVTWTLEQQLTTTFNPANDYGFSLSANPSHIVVGALRAGSDMNGRAIIFRWDSTSTSWIEDTVLASPLPVSGEDGFGHSVCIHDECLLVAQTGGNGGFVFRRVAGEWIYDNEALLPVGGGSVTGSCIDASGNKAILGIDVSNKFVVFRRVNGAWQEEATVATGSGDDSFGRPIRMSGNRIVTSARREDIGGMSLAGAAYIYEEVYNPPLAIDLQPADAEACVGAAATFTASATTLAPGGVVSFAWERDGVVIPGANDSTLIVDPVTNLDDGAAFRAQVTAAGCTVLSDPAILSLAATPLPVTVASATPEVICVPGYPVTLAANAPPDTEIVWYVDGCGTTFLSDENTVEVTPVATTTYYAKTRSLLPPFCESEDCLAVTVTLGLPPAPPVFVGADITTPVCPGTAVQLTASAPAGTIHWYDDCTGSEIGVGATISVSPLVTTTYFARVVEGVCESVCAEQTTVAVTTIPAPSLSASSLQVCPGAAVTLTASGIVGTPRLYAGNCGVGVLLAEGETELGVNPDVTTTYTLENFDPSTGCSSACSGVTVVVEPAPTIVAVPASATFCRGDTILLEVEANSVFPLTFQWFRNGVALANGEQSSGSLIAGAQSPSLSINNATDGDQAGYAVEVTSPCGSTSTAEVTATRIPFMSSVSAPTTLETIGGALVTLQGGGLETVDQLWVRTAQGEIEVAAFTTSPFGDSVEFVLPPIPPGCDCFDETEVLGNLVATGLCGEIDASSEGLAPLVVQINAVEVVPPDLQAAVDAVIPGTCLKLVSQSVGYNGPVTLANADRVTIAGVPVVPLVTRIQGEGVSGVTPLLPTLHMIQPSESVCVADVIVVHGNTGVLIEGGSGRLQSCLVTKNRLADIDHGGGVTITSGASPFIHDCDILDNATAGRGGGVRVLGAAVTIIESRIVANGAGLDGGGVSIEEATGPVTIADCALTNHTGVDFGGPVTRGGGLFWQNSAFMLGDAPSTGLLLRNLVASNSSFLYGAGMYLGVGVAPDIVGNVIDANQLGSELSRGGGLYVENNNLESFLLCRNVIRANVAQVGGGIALGEKNRMVATHNLVLCNQAVQFAPPPRPEDPPPPPFYAAGVWSNGSEVQFLHNTVYGNSGTNIVSQAGGFHHEGPTISPFAIHNNVFQGNEHWEVYHTTSFPAGHFSYNLGYDGADPDIFSVCYAGAAPACEVSTLELDPLLAAPQCASSDVWMSFALSAGSPAIGSGSDGTDRGAAQSNETPCWIVMEDCNENGLDDGLEFTFGKAFDSDLDGIPDICQGTPFTRGDCNRNGSNDLVDVILLLQFLFSGGNAPACDDACDANDDGTLGLVDALALLVSLFGSPSIPLAEPSACGIDPTLDALNCLGPQGCP